MKWSVGFLLALTLGAPSAALADVAPEPCEGAEEGDPCETTSGKQGVCSGEAGALTCEAEGEGCSASPGSLRGAAPGLAVVAGAALAFVAAKHRRKAR